jgi:hypothetical protein
MYVGSGHGLHVYWCLDRDVTLIEWQPVADALKAKCIELNFPADKSATADPARILRVPGTLNRKYPQPAPVRLLADNGSSIQLNQLASQLAVITAGASSKLAALVKNDDLVTKKEYREYTAEQVIAMLECIAIPENNGREDWITVLCAVQDWSHKSLAAFEIFHDWSASQPKYISREDCWRTWSSFEPGGGISIGTLVKLAKDAGWTENSSVTAVPDAISFSEQIAAGVSNNVPIPAPTAQVMQQIITSPLMIAAAHAVRATNRVRFDPNDAVQWLSNEMVMITDQDGLYYSMTNRLPMSRTVIDDLLTRYMPFNASGVPINASALLRRYGTVNSVNTIGFYPGAGPIYTEEGRTYVNHYMNPPDMLPGTANEIALIESFWDYCFPREEDKEFGEYLKQFYGHVVQHPSVKIASAPLMVSKEFGTGKTTMMFDIPRAIVGTHSTKLVSNKVLRSAFSDYLAGAHFLHFDEVHINGKWDSDDTANSMKNLITGKTVEIHPKGMKPYNIPNRVFITATSNYEDAITLPTDDERRWGVYYLRPTLMLSTSAKESFFGVLHKFINSPRGASVLRWYFSKVDLAGFDPQRAPPTTSAKRDMIGKSQSLDVQVIRDALQERCGPFAKDVGTLDAVKMFLHAETGREYPSVATRYLIQKAVPGAIAFGQQRTAGSTRVSMWAWRNLDKWSQATPHEIANEIKNQ